MVDRPPLQPRPTSADGTRTRIASGVGEFFPRLRFGLVWLSTGRCLLFPVLLLLSTADGGEGEWARFRGPNGTGISDAKTVPLQWTDEDYRWKVELPGVGHSSPVVWGNRIFLSDGDPETARRTILCLDAADGRTVWRRDYPSKTFRQHRSNSYASATPAVDAEGLVVTWSTPEEVVLLTLDPDGQEVWRRDLGPFVGKHGTGTSPIIVDDLVVLVNDHLYCIAKNGEVVVLAASDRYQTPWRVPLGEPSYATPAVSDGTMYLRTFSHLFALGGKKP